MIFWLIIAPLLISIALGVYLYFMQSHLVYQPIAEIEATPDEINLKYEDVDFSASDGTKLTGWFVPVEKPKATILFCHGNGGNISHRLLTLQQLHDLRLQVFIFDYRGYGRSEGNPSEYGTYLDAEAAWLYLTQERGVLPDKLIIHGRSLGGAIAVQLASKHNPAGLIVEDTPTSIPELGNDLYPFFPLWLLNWLSRSDYNAAEYIQKIRCPVLVMHSTSDEMIPFKHGQRLFEAANKPKKFVELSGGHNDAFIVSGTIYTESLSEFVDMSVSQ